MFHVPIVWKLLNPIFSVIFFRFEPCFCCFESHFFRWSPFKPLKVQVWPPGPIAIRRIVLNTSRNCRQMKHILNREIGKTCSHIFRIHPNEVKQKLSPQKQTRSTTSWTMLGFLWKKQGVPINPHKFIETIEVPNFPIDKNHEDFAHWFFPLRGGGGAVGGMLGAFKKDTLIDLEFGSKSLGLKGGPSMFFFAFC